MGLSKVEVFPLMGVLRAWGIMVEGLLPKRITLCGLGGAFKA